MSGRIVPSNRVKRGEVLPPEYEALGEDTQDPLRYSAQIEAVYLEAQRRDREGFSIDATVGGGSHREEDSELREYAREYDLSNPVVREAVMRDIEYKHERPGMSTSFAKHLKGLPEKHREKMREREEYREASGGRAVGRSRHKGVSASSGVKGHVYDTAPASAMRARVLAHSLYPNLNNKKFLLGNM